MTLSIADLALLPEALEGSPVLYSAMALRKAA